MSNFKPRNPQTNKSITQFFLNIGYKYREHLDKINKYKEIIKTDYYKDKKVPASGLPNKSINVKFGWKGSSAGDEVWIADWINSAMILQGFEVLEHLDYELQVSPIRFSYISGKKIGEGNKIFYNWVDLESYYKLDEEWERIIYISKDTSTPKFEDRFNIWEIIAREFYTQPATSKHIIPTKLQTVIGSDEDDIYKISTSTYYYEGRDKYEFTIDTTDNDLMDLLWNVFGTGGSRPSSWTPDKDESYSDNLDDIEKIWLNAEFPFKFTLSSKVESPANFYAYKKNLKSTKRESISETTDKVTYSGDYVKIQIGTRDKWDNVISGTDIHIAGIHYQFPRWRTKKDVDWYRVWHVADIIPDKPINDWMANRVAEVELGLEES